MNFGTAASKKIMIMVIKHNYVTLTQMALSFISNLIDISNLEKKEENLKNQLSFLKNSML